MNPIGSPKRVWLPALLFVTTCVSTTWAAGPQYAITLMAILLFHEMGHYLQAVRYRVPATLPHFIPFPSLFGTMGAVIRMNPAGADRRALFDIGVSGPLAGLVVALPATVWGLHRSTVLETSETTGRLIELGDSLLFKLLVRQTLGDLPDGLEVVLHPVAFAGWVGLFITALNLLPVGQLDGGHVLYALLGKRSHPIAVASMLGFLAVAAFVYWPWLIMAGLILLLIGVRHPPTADDTVALGRPRQYVGIAALVFFVLAFIPAPIVL